jgi:hypothetical protein
MNEFLIKNSILDIRTMPINEITDVQNGLYKGILALGYYEKEDTPSPIEYYLSNTLESDDAGSIIEIGNIKLEHRSINEIDLSYYGIMGNRMTNNSQFDKVISKIKKEKKLIIRVSSYIYFSSDIVIDSIDGLTILGYNSNSPDLIGDERGCGFDFQYNESINTSSFKIGKFTNLTLKNFNLIDKKNNDDGSLLHLHSGHEYIIDNVNILTFRGDNSIALKLGDDTGETSVFQGKISNCKMYSMYNKGTGVRMGATNTSTLFDRVYLGGFHFDIVGSTYCSFINTAVDTSHDHGYIIRGLIWNVGNEQVKSYSNALTFISCGSEKAAKSGFNIRSGSRNIDIQSPHSGVNNTDGSFMQGDLLTINIDNLNMGVRSIRVSSPEVVGGKKYSVYGDSEYIGDLIIENYDQSSFGAIGGNSNWIDNNITLIGDGKVKSKSIVVGSYKISNSFAYAELTNKNNIFLYPRDRNNNLIDFAQNYKPICFKIQVIEPCNEDVMVYLADGYGYAVEYSLGLLNKSENSLLIKYDNHNDFMGQLGLKFSSISESNFTQGKIMVEVTYSLIE